MKKILLGIIAINLILITGKMYLSNMQTAQAETSNEVMVCTVLVTKKGKVIKGLDKCKKGDILDIEIDHVSHINYLLRVCEHETINWPNGFIATCIYSGKILEVRD